MKEENIVVFVPQRPQTDRTGTIHPEITVSHSVESLLQRSDQSCTRPPAGGAKETLLTPKIT